MAAARCRAGAGGSGCACGTGVAAQGLPHVQDQEKPQRGATPCPRSEAAAGPQECALDAEVEVA